MNAAVISTGNEIVRGLTPDTNSSFISRLLLKHGFMVTMHISTGDSSADLSAALSHAREHSDFTVITGGLGPTDDDITVDTLCSLFGLEIAHDSSSIDKIKGFFALRKRPYSEKDIKMAAVPAGAEIIENMEGLAPGFVIHDPYGPVIALPGVPREMEHMMEHGVIPVLTRMFSPVPRSYKTVKIAGIKESEINSRVSGLVSGHDGVEWGICVNGGIAEVSFSWDGEENGPGTAFFDDMAGLFSHSMLLQGCESPEQELLLLLGRTGLTLSVAESCTGGLLSKRITDIPGSSESFLGGVVAYSNSAKIILLDVSESSISQSGAVSESVALEMARGAALKFGSDIAVSTTGIAGPGGATAAKHVGTVSFGFYLRGESRTATEIFPGGRDSVRRYSSLYAIEYIRRYLRAF